MNNTIWLNVGEASADIYGALLIQELLSKDKRLNIIGMGGPAMREAGLTAIIKAEDLSVMGLTEVVSALPKILGFLKKIKTELERQRPKVLVLFDAPDFNFRLARMAKKLGIPVVYYIAPQVWAWRKSRIKFLKKFVDRILCIFPFEQSFFARHGLKTIYVGHPLLQVMDLKKLNQIEPDPHKMVILPGSRVKEIKALLPVFADCCQILKQKKPDLTFSIVKAPHINQDLLNTFWPGNLSVNIYNPEDRHKIIANSCLALAASGTVTLECALLKVPAIVAYKLSRLSYLAGRLLVDVPFISMPNLILNQKIFPEYIQEQVIPAKLAEQALAWLDNNTQRQKIKSTLNELHAILGQNQATQLAARTVMEYVR
jgi:lipid-A-disaccharide synthase